MEVIQKISKIEMRSILKLHPAKLQVGSDSISYEGFFVDRRLEQSVFRGELGTGSGGRLMCVWRRLDTRFGKVAILHREIRPIEKFVLPRAKDHEIQCMRLLDW
jgi:hypothetical protein